MVESFTWCPTEDVPIGGLAPGFILSTSPSSWGYRGWWVDAGRRVKSKMWAVFFFKSVSDTTLNLCSSQQNQWNLIPWNPLSSPDSFCMLLNHFRAGAMSFCFLAPWFTVSSLFCSNFYSGWFSVFCSCFCFVLSVAFLVISAICYLGLSDFRWQRHFCFCLKKNPLPLPTCTPLLGCF